MRRGIAQATRRVAREHGVALLGMLARKGPGKGTWWPCMGVAHGHGVGMAWALVPAQGGAHERYEAVELLEAVGVGGEGGEAADSVGRLSGPPRSSHHRVASPQHLQAEVEVEVRAEA